VTKVLTKSGIQPLTNSSIVSYPDEARDILRNASAERSATTTKIEKYFSNAFMALNIALSDLTAQGDAMNLVSKERDTALVQSWKHWEERLLAGWRRMKDENARMHEVEYDRWREASRVMVTSIQQVSLLCRIIV
jgi:hypothetical protein